MAVTPAGFGLLAASLLGMAERTASGRLAFVLEGGYNLEVLREGTRQVLKSLSGGAPPSGPLEVSAAARAELEYTLRVFRRKWDIPRA
jgi:acetoin utilization deacetylase AcuC-like enzyme